MCILFALSVVPLEKITTPPCEAPGPGVGPATFLLSGDRCQWKKQLCNQILCFSLHLHKIPDKKDKKSNTVKWPSSLYSEKEDIQSALKQRGRQSEEGGTGVAGRAHRTCSCRLRSTCEGDTTGSSCGGSCRWCTGWSPGRCNHFVLLKQRNDGQIRDEGEKTVHGWAFHRTAHVQELDYFLLYFTTTQHVVCVSLWMLLLKNALQPSHDQTP